jgi:hypothetical protein
MKQLISLLLITSIAIISCTSFAKGVVIQVNSVNTPSSLSSSSIALTTVISNQHNNENYGLPQNKSKSNHNSFFQNTMIFNEKLQQFIAYFEKTDSKIVDIARNNLQQTESNKPHNKKCNTSS